MCSLWWIEIVSVVTGIAAPVLYRRLRMGPLRFSSDGFFLGVMGFFLAMIVTNPVGLFVGLCFGLFASAFRTYFCMPLWAILNLILGILGRWVWITVFLKPVNPSK